MNNTFFAPLNEYGEVSRLKEAIKGRKLPVRVTGCVDSQKCHIMAAASQNFKFRLIVTHNDLKAKEICKDYQLFDKSVMYYPAKDVIFYSADIRGNALVRERMKILKKLVMKEEVTVVTSIDGGMDKLMQLSELESRIIKVKETDALNLTELEQELVFLGYSRQGQVEAAGEFAVRGGIIDIFPLTEEVPYRIELWGDEVDSIRVFDVTNQRSMERVEQALIFPAAELIPDNDRLAAGMRKIDKSASKLIENFRAEFKTEEADRLRKTIAEFKEDVECLKCCVALDSYIEFFYQNTVSFFDYFDNENSIVFLDEPLRIVEKGHAVMTEFSESMSGRLEKGYILPEQADAVFDDKTLLAKLGKMNTILLSTMDYKFSDIEVRYKFDLEARPVNSFNNNFEMLVKELREWKKRGYRTVLVCPSHSRATRLAQDLCDEELAAFFSEDYDRVLQKGEIMVTYGNLSKGFEYPLLMFAIISESDIFGTKKRPKSRKVYEGSKIQSFAELNTGDYVVHETYGIGIYRGIEKIEVDKVVKDYIKVEYAGGGTLYVLASSMGLLQKYAGADAKRPKINKLDSNEWKNTKTRVKGAVQEIAGELVKLYATRQSRQGHSFCRDTVWQREFEEMFPYEETDDQMRAIDDTKADMESTRIMDRLICGDVGYGKTEIAIRAAFKAVSDNMQVVFLVPTTILAQQHYNTFEQRMRDFPISIGMLSRFRTPAEQRKTIERMKNGQLDILIGTHRILSKDIGFKRLGLLIVDEEQRFGVTHKEKIKQLKADVDVLTLTATPIPRTLHMSLVGIRDMSVLDEPPVDRMPIQTFVLEHNDEIIREAVNRELSRGGQVYYVYNRVQGIDEVASSVARLVPEASVAFAHGQMNERELERIMFSFINGEIDVLVSTTIIETGIDISNVNTIIIDDADRLGLAQLYQLRGRVGRSNRTAYAFLMYRRDKMLKEVAEKRLSAIKEFTELGSGFKIAMRDLEIRGAGNLLGAEQSGHMESVGYDLYCKMLNDAVKTLKGERLPEEYDTSIDMEMDAYIPSEYIRNEVQKLEMYKRIATIEKEQELVDMQEELLDRYGDIPVCVNNLLHIALAKATAHDAYITSLVHKRGEVKLTFYPQAKLDVAKLPGLLLSYDNRLKLVPGNPPVMQFVLKTQTKGKKTGYSANENVFSQIMELLAAIKAICLENAEAQK